VRSCWWVPLVELAFVHDEDGICGLHGAQVVSYQPAWLRYGLRDSFSRAASRIFSTSMRS
jgi:hypothetical protein